MDTPDKPLVPKTPGGGLAVGGIGAAILAGLGWLGNELLQLESRVARVETRWDSRIDQVDEDLADIRADMKDMRDRQLIVEQVITKTTVREYGPK